MVGPPIDLVTVFLCYGNYTGPFLYFVGVGLKFRAHGAAGPVYAAVRKTFSTVFLEHPAACAMER